MQTERIMINNDLPSIRQTRFPFPPGSHRSSYEIFYQICQDLEFPLVFCSPYDYEWEDGVFSGGFEWDTQGFYPVYRKIKPGFIFDKAFGADPHCTAVIHNCAMQKIPIFGPIELAHLCNDKWLCYQQFQSFSPLTWLLAQDRQMIIDQIYAFFDQMDQVYAEHDNKAIVKPLQGFQSRGIHVIERKPDGLRMYMLFGTQIHGDDIERNLKTMTSVPYLIQSWVNTGGGIPGVGFKNEYHDVRFVFEIREPGVAQFIMLYVKTLHGMKYIPLDYFQYSNPFKIVDPIADKISSLYDHGVFSVDVMRDIGGSWFLTELNDQVGLTMNVEDEVERNATIHFMRIYVSAMKRYMGISE